MFHDGHKFKKLNAGFNDKFVLETKEIFEYQEL